MTHAPEAQSGAAPSLFFQLRGTEPAYDIYQRGIELAAHADRLGYRTAWYSTRHFGSDEAAIPAIFPYLSAVARSVGAIRVGAAVVPLPLHQPIHVVEQAVVTDVLAGGRLELGVGKGLGRGFSSIAYAAFQLNELDRETLYSEKLAQLKTALQGSVATEQGLASLNPPPGSLAQRLWQSTGNRGTARQIGSRGDGLIPHGNSEALGGGGVYELIEEYLDALPPGMSPRIAFHVSVLPSADLRHAEQIVAHDASRHPEFYRGKLSGSIAEYLSHSKTLHGSSETIIEQIRVTAGIVDATEVLYHIPLAASHPEFEALLAATIHDIHPSIQELAAARTPNV